MSGLGGRIEFKMSSVCVGAFESFTGGRACFPFPYHAGSGHTPKETLAGATLLFLSLAEFTNTGLSYFTSEFSGGIIPTCYFCVSWLPRVNQNSFWYGQPIYISSAFPIRGSHIGTIKSLFVSTITFMPAEFLIRGECAIAIGNNAKPGRNSTRKPIGKTKLWSRVICEMPNGVDYDTFWS